jgi:hypothetical protein
MRRITLTVALAAAALAATAAPATAIETAGMRQPNEIRHIEQAREPFASLRWLTGLYENATGSFPWEIERWRPLVTLYFPEDRVEWALRIIACESGGDPNAKNPHSSASGLFQHLARLWPERAAQAGFRGADVFDPAANVAVAAWLLDNGGTGHWVCKART